MKIFIFALLLSGVAWSAGAAQAAAAEPFSDEAFAADTAEAVLDASAVGSERLPDMERLLEIAGILNRMPRGEREELFRLYRRDPALFRRTLTQRLAAAHSAAQVRSADLVKLVASYHMFAADPERQKLIRGVLFAAVRNEFDRRLDENRRRLDELSARLEELRKEYRFREKNADAIIEAKLTELLALPAAAAGKKTE